MYTDSVLEELWRVKDEHAAKYGYDIPAMAVALREGQGKSGHAVVSFSAGQVASETEGRQDKRNW